ncbi:MAG: Gx transporter family protein [Elusimicrobiota bacterium]
MTQNKSNLLQVSFLIACGSALQLAEAFIPFPLPGMRIGLANISTVLGLILFGPAAAFEIALFRPIITSLTNGTFLMPGLYFSFFGSITSFAVMAVIFSATKRNKIFSLAGISVMGAITHNITQLLLARYWLIPHAGVLAFAPILVITGLIGGYLVGWASEYIYKKINEAKLSFGKLAPSGARSVKKGTLILADKLKILAAFGMVISTIFLKTPYAYVVLLFVVLILIIASGQQVSLIFKRVFTLWAVIIFSFFLPVVFTQGGKVLLYLPFIKVTVPGVIEGIIFVLRLVFLIMISIWIGVTRPEKLSQELEWLLSPLKIFKIPVDRIPRLTSLSLSFLPLIWERLNKVKPKKLTLVLDALVGLFIGLE